MARPEKNRKISSQNIAQIRAQVLDWYDQHARSLPWREPNQDPYKVWLSEIMLQQTTVTAVIPYYEKFLQHWPDVKALAAARQEDVLEAWAGLGYYSRARNLHKCANVIVEEHGGIFPQDQKQLLKLPGVGDYTSAAIMTIAFDQPAAVMDGNIERIIARIFRVEDALPKAKPVFKSYAEVLFESMEQRSGDFAQALMDIGSGVCIAKIPRCDLCPISDLCTGQDIAGTLPMKIKKKPVPHKVGFAYWVENEIGQVLLHRRPEKGMLAGLVGFPTSDWQEDLPKDLFHNRQFEDAGSIKHVFTHFSLTLHIKRGSMPADTALDDGHYWEEVTNIKGLPTLFKKVEDAIKRGVPRRNRQALPVQ